jgi:hypothetical protein
LALVFNPYHNSANLAVRFGNKFVRQSDFPVENFVDYLPRLSAKIPFSPLASCSFFLLCTLNPYLSMANSHAALFRKRLPRPPVSANRLCAFHNCS